MPTLGCPFCHAPTHVPDDWPYPGFTCSVCHRPVAITQMPPREKPSGLVGPDFLPPAEPRRGWGWIAWLIFLSLGGAITSASLFLITHDEIWLMALGGPSVALLTTSVVWAILRHSGNVSAGEG